MGTARIRVPRRAAGVVRVSMTGMTGVGGTGIGTVADSHVAGSVRSRFLLVSLFSFPKGKHGAYGLNDVQAWGRPSLVASDDLEYFVWRLWRLAQDLEKFVDFMSPLAVRQGVAYISRMDIPDEAPVMTLPNVTLFPQSLMRLHIFEPRYRRMLEEVLHTRRMMIIAMRKPGVSREIPFAVAGLGLVPGLH